MLLIALLLNKKIDQYIFRYSNEKNKFLSSV